MTNTANAADPNEIAARLYQTIADAIARAGGAERALDYAISRHAADWQRAEDALVAAGVEMFDHGDHLTIEDGIAQLAERSRADGLVVATLLDMTGAESPDDLVRVVGEMMREAQNAPKER